MKKISYLFIIFIVILLFRKLFLPGPAVYGDAPYFYSTGLRELMSGPVLWLSRGYSLGGKNQFLWIYPLMYLYGLLGTIFHLNNDLIVRILFYFPSLVFGFTGSILLIKHLKYPKAVYLFATLVYLVNTYFLLVVDGGQVGVTLAYGFFPFVVYVLLRFIDNPKLKNFLISLFFGFIITVVDFRISAICFLTVFLLRIDKTLKIKYLFIVVVCVVGLSMYWIIPSLKLGDTISANQISSLSNTSFLNTFLLSSPSWPNNEFGKNIAPYFYFFIIPVLLFYPLFFLKDRKILRHTIVFLFIAFLVKGESYPLGIFYKIFVNTSFGSVFRDSTKFFIPLTLIGGILIGITIFELSKKFNKKIIYLLFTCYFLFLVWQGFAGRLNGVLGKNVDSSDFQKFEQLISSQNGFFRTAWFTEKSPFSPHTEEKQAFDAKDLVNFRPFASMNIGSGDHFNFMNNPQYIDWFNLLGIKYLALSGNPRTAKLSDSDQKDWNRLNDLLAKDNKLTPVNIGTKFSIYQTPSVKPNKFFVDKTFLVIGGDDVYQKLKNIDNNFSVGNQGFLFAEDGKINIDNLDNISPSSLDVVLNNEGKESLKMSFLKNNFISPTSAYYSQWALRKSSEFLDFKYELLNKNIDYREFDYNQGIAFSSQPNEELKFNMKVPKKGDYYLEVRSMNASNSGDLKLIFNKTDNIIKRTNSGNFEWYQAGPINLDAGNYSLNLQNTYGVQVINTVALVSSDDLEKANKKSEDLLAKFSNYDLNNINDKEKIKLVLEKNKWQDLSQISNNVGWLIFTDSFNTNWVSSFPMYSMINGFYFDNDKNNFEIKYNGYQDLNLGIYLSLSTFVLIGLATIWCYKNERKNKGNN